MSSRRALMAGLLPALSLAFTPGAVPASGASLAIQPGRAYEVVKDLVAFGPRVAGTLVQEKASAYLVEQYRKAGYDAKVATFSYSKTLERAASLVVSGQAIDGASLQGSASGKVDAGLVAVPGVGTAEDFAQAGAKGKIAVVRRGQLRFYEKTANAEAAGAVGLIVVNNDPGDDPVPGTLGDYRAKIPVLGVGHDSGEALLARLASGQVSGRLDVEVERIEATGRNVVAHLPRVDKPRLVLGGHYDSVQGAPGANDNASGTAVVLEVARAAAGSDVARQAWFVAFDGEEDGLYGSRAFVRDAPDGLLQGLDAMLNFDMVGVNRQLLFSGSEDLVGVGKSVHPSAGVSDIDGRSDHAPFLDAGVPAVAFERGLEPNYHRPTDADVDPKLLDETADAALAMAQRILATGKR